MSSIIDEKWERFVLICKPEQSGKTFIMIQSLINDLTEPIKDKAIINIIYCDNNLLLTQQTCKRVDNDLKDLVKVGEEIYLEFSSHKRTEYRKKADVGWAILSKEIKNILCCTNSKRMDDIYDLINELIKIKPNELHFKIWLDEADKFTNFIDTTLKPLVDKFENIDVYCITATPKKLFIKYKIMNVLPIENTTTENYHGWEDNNIIQIKDSMTVEHFVEYILDNYNINIKPGTKWFIPAKVKKSSHKSIKNICISRGFAILVVNGDGIILYLPNNKVIKYDKDIDFNTKIKSIYKEQQLHKYPLAITGNICVSRGITIMSDDFIIDFAILSACSNQQEASQISGRMKGNMKQWQHYKVPTIYTTPKFNKIAIEWEKKSRNLGKLAFQKESDNQKPFIDSQEYKTCGEKYEYKVDSTYYESYKKAKEFLKTKQREMKCKITIERNPIHNINGYSISSKLLNNGRKTNSLTKDDRIFKEGLVNISRGTCISSTDKGSRYLIIPFYENEESLGNEVKFEVRYISFETY